MALPSPVPPSPLDEARARWAAAPPDLAGTPAWQETFGEPDEPSDDRNELD